MIRWLFRWTFNSYRKPPTSRGKTLEKHAELAGLKRKWFETDRSLKERILFAMYGGKGNPPKKSWYQRLMDNRRATRSWP